MKLPIVGIIFFLIQLSVNAQETPYKPAKTSTEKSLLKELDIQQDSRIDTLLNNHIEMNKRKEGTDGFRLEIFFSSGVRARQEAMKVRTEFLRIYPDLPAYMTFQSPNFKIRVGDCRTKSQALRMKERIKKNYPNAFIVPDLIQFPKLYTADSNK
ncbi:SPOR domain-containing protein [Mangrovibacterium lignilyticum]|uniref:SPOR domain-containing protein n=1 Tax=Mangrovibacterium lignilyticum TaxID=2668052 RepID=UPI0013D35627|nr:SPOR domain-containing protein [Mangrovibacterium lignilyticum]